MPWCPKCKNEYREGIEKCAECGVDLVESLENLKEPLYFAKEREELDKIKEFLEMHKITGGEITENVKEDVWELSVPSSTLSKCKRLLDVYMLSKLQEEKDDADVDEDAKENAAVTLDRKPVFYEDNDTKAKENKSSAAVLLFVGIVGMAGILLCIAGILPVPLSSTSKYMVFGTMSAMFLLFIIMGMISVKSYKVFATKAQSDSTLKESIDKWVKENLTKESVEEEIGADDAVSEEEKYFRRTKVMQEKISQQFLNLDEMFLERFVDDVYSEMYGEE